MADIKKDVLKILTDVDASSTALLRSMEALLDEAPMDATTAQAGFLLREAAAKNGHDLDQMMKQLRTFAERAHKALHEYKNPN